MSETPVCHTVADLIAELSKLPPDAIPFGPEPRGMGVRVYPQADSNKVFLAPVRDAELIGRPEHLN